MIAMNMNETDSRLCCSMEKKRLMEELWLCDMCCTSYEEHHRCYRDTAWTSAHRARSCMLS